MPALATIEKIEKNNFPPMSIPNAIPGFSIYVRRRKSPMIGRLAPIGMPRKWMARPGRSIPFTMILVIWSARMMNRLTFSMRTRTAPGESLRGVQFAREALLGVGHRLEPLFFDQLSAHRAPAVFAALDAREGILQMIEKLSFPGGEQKGLFPFHGVRPLLHVGGVGGVLARVLARGRIHHRVPQRLELLKNFLFLLKDDFLEILELLLAVGRLPDGRLRGFRFRHFGPGRRFHSRRDPLPRPRFRL